MRTLDSSTIIESEVENVDSIIINRKFRKSVRFPRYISLDADLLRAVYLFWGDGSYKQKIHFTNKEPWLHIYIINTFEAYFDIPKSSWRLRILYNHRKGKKVDRIKDNWLRELSFDKRQLYNTVAISGYKSNPNGNARIIIDKLTYCDFLRSFLMYVNKLIEDRKLNEFQLVSVLDGILNAEGSALIDSVGLHKVVITLNKNEVSFVKNILFQLSIEDIFKERQDKLIVSNWRNLYSFVLLFVNNDTCPFSLHDKRRSNLLNGFLNHKRTIPLYNYLSIIEKNPGISLKRLSIEAKRHPSSVQVVILERLKEFATFYGGRIPGKKYKIYLSQNGKEFLYVIRKLNTWRLKEVNYENGMDSKVR